MNIKRENDKSLSEIEDIDSAPFSKELKRENSQYPGEISSKVEEDSQTS